jgi:hypothetical protein
VQHPSVVPDLVRFQKRLKLASNSLGKALQSLLAAPDIL